jgi:hypothetical protein
MAAARRAIRGVVRACGRDLRGALEDDVAASGLVQAPPGTPVLESDLMGLPSSTERYLRASGVIGRPRDRSFAAHLHGRFRLRPNQRPMRCETWQCNTVAPVARLFHMRIDFAGFVPMVGRDTYVAGHGRMRGTLLHLVAVADGSGDEFDLSELATYLNDAVVMAPSMLLVPEVTFTAVDDASFDVSITDAGRTVAARVFLDDAGHPRDFRTSDRFADLPGGLRRAEWSTPLAGWHAIAGRALPRTGAAVWKLVDGDLAYLEFTFDDRAVTYNPSFVPTLA